MPIDKKRIRKYRFRILRRIFLSLILLALITLIIFTSHSTINELILDKTAPEIVLSGRKTMTILAGEEFNEPGYSATDNGVDFTEKVEVKNNVNTNEPGKYFIGYFAKDDSGNETAEHRTVIVEKEYNFNTKDPDFYLRSLENYIKEKGWKVSLGFYSLNNHVSYIFNGSQEYYGASLIKPVAALYAYENLNLTTKEKELIKQSITVSNNEAYAELADIIGLNNLKQYGNDLGLTNFMADKNNVYYSDTTVENQLTLWKKIWQFVNTNKNGSELKKFFINDEENYIKFDDSISVMHKYGYWDEVFHDTGIVLDESPYIVVILTNEGESDHEEIIKNISKKLYNFNKIIKNS